MKLSEYDAARDKYLKAEEVERAAYCNAAYLDSDEAWEDWAEADNAARNAERVWVAAVRATRRKE